MEEDLVCNRKGKGNEHLYIYFFLQNRKKMNQLQALLNDSLLRTKHVENAAIINIKERKVCASTFGFHVRDQKASWEVTAEVETRIPECKAVTVAGSAVLLNTRASFNRAARVTGLQPSCCVGRLPCKVDC